jgi:para-nitrobenzyl esterase
MLLLVAILCAAAYVAYAVYFTGGPGSGTGHYTTAETTIATVLDDPAARAIVDKHVPGFSQRDRIALGRPFTLKQVQSHAGIPDEVMAKIDADFAQQSEQKQSSPPVGAQ